MGNLGRPGYTASTEGMWPYSYVTCTQVPSSRIAYNYHLSYDSCDVGTFPNQTYANQSGPAAALSSTASKAKYNFDLSWLPGQKASYGTHHSSYI